MTTFLDSARALLSRAFKPDDARIGIVLLRGVCEELLADIPGTRTEAALGKLRWINSDEDIRYLRLAVFDAVSHARGQAEAVARIETFDRRVFLNSAYGLLRD